MSNGFHVAPFAPDGALQGVGFREFSALSARWLGVARAFLDEHGDAFRATWGGELAALETRFTYSQGAALVTFFAAKEVVTSHLLLTGRDPEAEAQVAAMFVQSLAKVDRVRLLARTSPFAEALSLPQRPLEVLVLWAPQTIAAELLESSHELARHCVAAFFQRVAQAQ